MSQITQEKSILEVQAAVYNYDNNIKNWAPKDGGASRVFIFHNPQTGAYRVIGQSIQDKTYNINAPLKPDLVHKKLRDNFVQWRYRQTVIGLSFSSVEDADKFDTMVAKIVAILQGPESDGSPTPSPASPAPLSISQPTQSAQQPAPMAKSATLGDLNAFRARPVSTYIAAGPDAGSSQSLGRAQGRRTQSTYSMAGGPPVNGAPGSGGIPQSHSMTSLTGASDPTPQYSSSTPYHHGTLRRGTAPSPHTSTQDLFGQQQQQQQQSPQQVPLSPNSLLVKDPKDLTPRDLRAKELYTSEESYMMGLEVIIDKYLDPAKRRNLFAQQELRTLFSNIESIRDMSRDLLESMRDVMNEWNDQATLLGEIFLHKLPFLKIYTIYCNNHKAANELLAKLQSKRDVSRWMKECQLNSNFHLDLNALLITPVQRVPRYQLLLKELLRLTDESHPDYQNLVHALEQIKKIADSINESVLRSDSTKEVHALSKQIPEILGVLRTTRQLVKHGPVKVTTTRTPTIYTYLLLFSDIAVFASPIEKRPKKLKIGEKVSLHHVWPDAMLDTSSAERTWQINTPDNTYLIETPNKDEKTLWLDQISQRILAQCERKGVLPEGATTTERRTFRYKFSRDGSSYKGEWQDAKMDGQGTFTYATKTAYEGAFRTGRFHGKGKITYCTGEVYDGEWVRDKPHGYGILQLKTATHKGQWEHGLRHGRGETVWVSGDKYEGDYVNDMREGQGAMTSADGSSYTGGWKGDKQDGQGTETSHFGTYEGEWAAGRKTGKGTMRYTTGDTYTGQWLNDLRHGEGAYASADGSYRYEGGWADDVMDGKGTLQRQNERYEGEMKGGRKYGTGKLVAAEGTYDGMWADDRREGKGVWKAANGSSYEGEWHSDLQFGKGTLIEVGGGRYDGKFVKGRKEGSGVMTYPSGAKYSGNWQRDRRHGKGVFSSPDEKIKYVGDWVDDYREGKGELTDPSGFYDGEWKLDMRHGIGKFTDLHGNVYTGQFREDKRDGEGILTLANPPKELGGGVIRAVYSYGALVEPLFNERPPDLGMPKLLLKK